MKESEEYKAVIDALEHAHAALQREASAEHAKTRPPRGAIVTCDMCPCGESTGLGKTDKCKSVGVLQVLMRSYKQAMAEAVTKESESEPTPEPKAASKAKKKGKP